VADEFIDLGGLGMTEEPSSYLDIMTSEDAKKADSFPAHLANERAEKLHLALGEKSPGLVELTGSLSSAAGEYSERVRVSGEESTKLREIAIANLSNMLREKKSIDPKAMEEARALMNKQDMDPDTVFEQVIAREHMNGPKTVEELIKNTGANIDPKTVEAFKGVMEEASGLSAKREYAQRVVQELETEIEKMGLLEFGGNIAGQMVPLLSSYRKYDRNVEGLLSGSNVATQVKDYYFKPLEVGSKEFQSKINELKASNPLVALDFAKSFVEGSYITQQMDNLFDVFDIATAPGAGLLGKAGRNLARMSINNVAGRNQALGNFTQATNTRAIDEMRARAMGQTTPQDFRELENALPTLANPSAYFGSGSGVVNPIGVARAVNEISQFSDDIIKSLILERNPIDRINPEVKAIMERDNLSVFRARYTNTNGAIMDVRWVNGADEGLANTDSLSIRIGTPWAHPFLTKQQAEVTARSFYGLEDFKVVEAGGDAPGFAIEARRHIDENLSSTYAQMHTPTQGSRWNYIGIGFSADNFVDDANRTARKQAGYGVSGIEVAVRKYLKDIPSLKSREMNDFLAAGRDNQRTYYSSHDMERAWQNLHGRLPTEQEVIDYYKVVQLHELDYALRNTGVLAQKASQGFEKHTLPLRTKPTGGVFDNGLRNVPTPAGAANDNGVASTRMGSFDLRAANSNGAIARPANDTGNVIFDQVNQQGVLTKNLPGNDTGLANQNLTKVAGANDNKTLEIEGKYLANGIPWDTAPEFRLAVWDADPNNIRIVNKNNFTTPQRVAELNDLVTNQGYKVIQPSPYEAQKFIDADIPVPHFVLVKDFKSSRLSFNQIPKKEGGAHVVYSEGSSFISQANVKTSTRGGTRSSTYVGNNNFLWFDNANRAADILPRIERARQLLQANDIQGLQTYLARNLPYTVQQFRSQFDGFGGTFDVTQPFTVRGDGVSMFDNVKNLRGADGNPLYPNITNIVDGPLNPFNKSSFIKFSQERNEILNTIDQGGNLAQANLLNPKDAIVAATESLMSSRYLDDLKIKSTRDFITRYQNLLNVSLEEALRDPVAIITNPPWKTAGVDSALLAEARNARRATMEFLHMETQQTKDLRNMMTRIYDSIFPEDSLVRQGVDGLNEFSGQGVTNPLTFMRRWAFRLTQMSPDALLTQATQVVNAVSIGGPVAGLRGAGAMLGLKALRAMKYSDDAINLVANRYAKATGTKPEHYKEMVAGYRRSGFGDVSEESTMAEGLGRPNVMIEGGQQAIHAGLTFFREGERVTREVAYSTAYYQWRAANPTTKMTKAIENQILNKADVMAGSMSKASNASWSNGVFSVPTQFLRYQWQLMEQIWIGRELTRMERARLLGGQTIMWGIPTGAVGAAFGVAYPWAEPIAQILRNNGVDTDSNKVSKLAVDGVASVLFELAYGEKYDVAGRFGPRGISLIKDYTTGRKELVEILAGPSGKLLYDVMKTGKNAISNGIQALVEQAADDTGTTYKPLVDDVVSIFNNAALGRKGYEFYYALNYHTWVTKNRPNGVDGVTNSEAYIRFLTGLSPDRIQEHYSKQDSLIMLNKAQDAMRDKINLEYRKYYANIDDPVKSDAYLQRIEQMYIQGGFTTGQRYQILKRSLEEGPTRDTVESVNRRYLRAFPKAEAIVNKTRDEREEKLKETTR